MQKVVVARAAAAAAAAASTEPHATPKKGLSLFKSAGRAALTANAMRLEQIQRGDCMLIASLLIADAMRLEQIQRGDCMLIASLLACTGVEERRRASALASEMFRQAVASEQAAAAEAARLEAEEQTNARKAALEAALAEV
jgi:hypothetical protein